MKPISLVLENFRSYRSHAPIEFGEAALVAIVGPTGAGKSTILEAMVYALYGERSDSGQKLDELISFNERALGVTFRFAINGREYEVYRQRRNGIAVQRLTMPDGSSLASLDDVNQEIEALLGLDKRAFLKTVLLPQGRFSELLLETGGRRAEILRQVLGLSFLDALNVNAKSERERVLQIKSGAQRARALLPTSSENAEQQAVDALATAEALATKLGGMKAEFQQLQATITEADAKAKGINASLEVLETAGTLKDAIQAVRAKDAELTPRLSAAVAEAIEAGKRLEGACTALEQRNTAGMSAAALAAVHRGLLDLTTQRNERKADETNLQGATTFAKERSTILAAANTASDKAQARLRPLAGEENAAAAAHQMAANAERQFRELLTQRTGAEQVVTKEAAAANTYAAKVGTAETAATKDAVAYSAAKAALDAATEAQSSAERSNAAAFLGAHLHAGDACPVCSAEIPASFHAVAAQDIEKAKATVGSAKSAERALATKHQGSLAALQSAKDAHKHQLERVTNAQEALAAIDARITEVCGRSTPEKKAEALLKAVEAAARILDLARTAVSDARVEQARATEAFTQETAQAAKAESALTEAATRVARRDAQIATILDALPERWRPLVDDIVTLVASCEQEQGVTGAAEATAREAEISAGIAANAKAELERDAEREVNGPLQSIRDRANALAAVTGLPVVQGARPVASYFDEVLASVETHRIELVAQHEALGAKRSHAMASSAALVETAGGDIVDRHATATADVSIYKDRLAAVRTQLEQVRSVDQLIASATPVHVALDAVVKNTAANQFPEYLTNQYVTRLLTLASGYFFEMTGRFRFAPPKTDGPASGRELRILDGQTGGTMPPENLSGGEKFLASLALSLRVVDQAALAGARIDSLFLDEGFGSLDAESLDRAMMELRSRARKGRSIWIITHLREVARYADRTYLVENRSTGSRLQIHEGDLEEPVDAAGLLTALT